MKRLITFFLSMLIQIANAAEVDNFTTRNLILKDVKHELNALANNYLIKAINNSHGCSKDELYKELKKYFSNHTKGELVKDILERKKIKSFVTPINKTIYKHWKPSDGIAMGFKSSFLNSLSLTPIVNINGIKIGVDKLEHMFGMGWQYYEDNYIKKKGIYQTLKNGAIKEKFILGGSFYVTGVFSYGDLAANFNGMRFWNNILGESEDILGPSYSIEPYVKCKNSKWVMNSPIDFSHYIDFSMDESVNCSKFARKKTAARMDHIIRELGIKTNQTFCELDQEKLLKLKLKYGNYSIYYQIINLWGIGKFDYKGDI